MRRGTASLFDQRIYILSRQRAAIYKGSTTQNYLGLFGVYRYTKDEL